MVEAMQTPLGRQDVFATTILGLIGVGIPLWLAAEAGAIGLPTIDDWVYMQGAENLFRNGSLHMPGHTTSAIGQLVLAQPLMWLSGGSTWAFTAFGLIMTLVGLVATYLLARRFVGTGSAAMVVLLVEVFPGFARLSASFMTDIPAYALVMLCLLLGTRWLQGEGGRLTLLASLGLGLVAVSIREYALAAPVTILAVAWARTRPGERVLLASISVAFVAGVAGVLLAGATLPGRAIPTAVDVGRLLLIGPAFTTFAAVLLPAVVLGFGRRMAVLGLEQVILAVGIVSLLFVLPYGAILGFLWLSNGVMGNALLSGVRDVVVGSVGWEFSNRVASFAAILLAALLFTAIQRSLARANVSSPAITRIVRLFGSREAPLIMFLLVYSAALIAFLLVIGISDRYLLPLLPVAAILLLRGPWQTISSGRSLAFSHAAFGWLAVSAFVIAANSFAYDAARWREGETAVAMRFDARTVDAGYEWVGYHSSTAAQSGSGTYGLTWYDDFLLPAPPCAVVSNSPLEGGPLTLIRVNRAAYRQYLFFGPDEPLYLYRATSERCPPVP